MSFEPAKRKIVAPKIAIMGVSGGGKTYSALRFARGFVGPSGRIAFIDTENGSASLYSNLTPFDVCNIRPIQAPGVATSAFNTTDFVNAIADAVKARYDFLVIDSASNVWASCLELKARLDANGGNQFTNWKVPKERLAQVKNAILQAPVPVLCCFRCKTEYVLETTENGGTVPRRVGLAPVASTDWDYDYSLVLSVDRNHKASVIKSRSDVFNDDFNKVLDESDGERFRQWVKG